MSAAGSEHYARELGRVLGTLGAWQDELRADQSPKSGRVYRVVGSARQLLHDHAERAEYDVEPECIEAVEAAELKTVSEFCAEAADNFETRDQQQVILGVADLAAARLAQGGHRR